jgi:hypothetical protein
MKNSFVMSAILIVALVVISCKKDKHDDGSSGGKKWRVTTVAGDGFSGFNDGPALTARFKTVLDVAVTPDGSIYVADALNHRIRKIAGGMVSTFAGLPFLIRLVV